MKNMKTTRTKRTPGFTMVELLVVVAIIVTLIAILLPALSKVKESAKTASTKAMINNFLNACDSFQIDQQRLPGYFSQTTMGAEENGGASVISVGLTSMENALIDLAGGIIPDDHRLYSIPPDNSPGSAGFGVRYVGPFSDPTDDTNKLHIDISSVGTGEFGGGYFSANDGNLAPVEGQYNSDNPISSTGMPDLIDNWGQPIMLWVRDEGARGTPPANVTDFTYVAQVTSDAGLLDPTERALFYWGTNCGYLKSEALGESAINQSEDSIIGSENAASQFEDVQRAISAITGSPSFPAERPTDNDPWRPAEPRGSIIAVSAGSDQVFFKMGKPETPGANQNLLFFAPSGGTAFNGGDPAQSVDDFDDLISSTGG